MLFDYFYGKGSKVWGIPCLRACAAVTKIYSYLPHATVSSLVFQKPFSKAHWFQRIGKEKYKLSSFPLILSLPQVFSCIAMLDSGTCDIEPDHLSEVFAISTGNSIFVSSALVEDVHKQPNLADVRRVTGNIGQPGISFLIGP